VRFPDARQKARTPALTSAASDLGVLHQHRPTVPTGESEPVDVVDIFVGGLAVVLGQRGQVPAGLA
jgi:hypothetical protein